MRKFFSNRVFDNLLVSSDFSLPWTNNPSIGVRRTRKPINRRNRTKR